MEVKLVHDNAFKCFGTTFTKDQIKAALIKANPRLKDVDYKILFNRGEVVIDGERWRFQKKIFRENKSFVLFK